MSAEKYEDELKTKTAPRKPGWVNWLGREIELNGTYLLYFPDKKREMTKEQRAEYDKIMSWPEKLRWRGLVEMNPELNPNVIKVTGRVIIQMCEEQGYIPQFDEFFDDTDILRWLQANSRIEKSKIPKPTRRLTLLPVEGYEWFKDSSIFFR